MVELGSNDGYLLQYFVARGIPVLGVEPAANVAEVAASKGVPSHVALFSEKVARELAAAGRQADLIAGNNVLAQVHELNDFVAGIKALLKPRGVVTIEFPHLMRLMDENQFDTIYHEHFSYFSFITAERIFAAHGLTLFDVEELTTHGGSLRIYGRHAEDASRPVGPRVGALREREERAGFATLERYASFTEQVKETKRKLLDFLICGEAAGQVRRRLRRPREGQHAPELLRDPHGLPRLHRRPEPPQAREVPAGHPHPDPFRPSAFARRRPDYVLILPWNLKAEIVAQMAFIREWGGQFVVPIPELQVLSR